MGKRSLVYCDLCKSEVSEDIQFCTFAISKIAKKPGNKFEACLSCTEKILSQFVGSNKLDPNWSFANKRETLASSQEELEIDKDAERVKRKKAELAEAGIELQGEEHGNPECMHLNKGRVQTTIKDKQRFAYRVCANNECRKRIPVHKRDERLSYMNEELPEDVRVDHKG